MLARAQIVLMAVKFRYEPVEMQLTIMCRCTSVTDRQTDTDIVA